MHKSIAPDRGYASVQNAVSRNAQSASKSIAFAKVHTIIIGERCKDDNYLRRIAPRSMFRSRMMETTNVRWLAHFLKCSCEICHLSESTVSFFFLFFSTGHLYDWFSFSKGLLFCANLACRILNQKYIERFCRIESYELEYYFN